MQYPGHHGFVGPSVAYDCMQCIAGHGEQFKFPPLEQENLEAWSYWQILTGQVRAVGGLDVVILGIDYAAIVAVFDIYRIPLLDRPLLFEKILVIDREAEKHRERQRKVQDAERKVQEKFRMENPGLR